MNLRRALAARRGTRAKNAPTVPPALLELARAGGPAPLGPAPDASRRLAIAVVVPSFRRGSGGHATIVRLARELARLGHQVSVWLEDVEGRHAAERKSLTRSSFSEFFDADGLPLQVDFSAWQGADVILATGWQTVARALLLEGCGARAYLVQDHEPEFYGTSAESLWAAQTYRQELHCIAASPWLAELLRRRYGADASHFDLGVDGAVYRPAPAEREEALVAFYARAVTPRRAVPLGLAALAELHRRRSGVRIVLFGEGDLGVPFPCTNLGVAGAADLATLYRRATVGMVLSLTNPSLIGLEMMACGLPCVELASESMLASFGREGPLALAEPDPLALCDAIERLLDDAGERERRSRSGTELADARTWAAAGRQVEEAIRRAAAPGG